MSSKTTAIVLGGMPFMLPPLNIGQLERLKSIKPLKDSRLSRDWGYRTIICEDHRVD